MKWLENCRLKCSFWWWWKDLIKINSREPLCCAYWEDEGRLVLLPWCRAKGWRRVGWGGGGVLLRCRALHFYEAKRVRDGSLMTQTQTSWRMPYGQQAAERRGLQHWQNTTGYYSLPKIQTLTYKSLWNIVTNTEWANEKNVMGSIAKHLLAIFQLKWVENMVQRDEWSCLNGNLLLE